MRALHLVVVAWIAFGLVDGANQRCMAASSPRTIVILGSSTAHGDGASSYAKSWAGRLESALGTANYTVRNVSISGSNTGDSLSRFDRDVVPYNPDFVLLATSIVNELPAAAVANYLHNTSTLIRKVEAIGATPILVAPYPNDGFSQSMYGSIKDIYLELAGEGVPVLDFLDAADNGSGHWAPGLSLDGTHPTDLGHQLLFETIPLSMFGALLQHAPCASPHGFGSWLQTTAQDAGGALEIWPGTGMTSWTLSFWFKPGDSPSERILASVNHDVFQLRRLGNSLRFLQGGLVLAAFPFARRPGFRHVAITYRSISGILRVYFDGIHQMEIIVPAAAPATTFNFGGSVGHPAFNATGDSLADILLYRAPLAPGDIGDIVALQPSWKSIEAWLPLTHSPVRPSLNFAATSVTTVVNGSWVWSDDPLTGIFPFREPHRNRVASKQRDEPR